jgi:nucleoside-diphosphate-sugar epimerase
MKVFLTGGTGVIGRPTVTRLVDAGHAVRAVARREEAATALERAGAEPVMLDLFDADAVRAAVVGSDAIVHLATNVPPFPKVLRPKAWAPHNRLRAEGTRILVDAARTAGVERLIRESVTFLYADGGDRWLDESSPLIANPGLVAPAIDGERFAADLTASGGVAVSLRFGLFYGGPGNRGTDELLRLAKLRSSMTAGKGSAYMSSLHTADAATAVVAALDAPDGIYNVCDDEPLTRRDALDAFAAAFGLHRLHSNPSWALRLLAGPATDALTASQRVSNQKFRTTTGWGPRYPSLREGWRAEADEREVSHA